MFFMYFRGFLEIWDSRRREWVGGSYLPAPTFKSSGDAMKARMRQEVVMSFGPEIYSVAAK